MLNAAEISLLIYKKLRKHFNESKLNRIPTKYVY